jgi:hypothetical protein
MMPITNPFLSLNDYTISKEVKRIQEKNKEAEDSHSITHNNLPRNSHRNSHLGYFEGLRHSNAQFEGKP